MRSKGLRLSELGQITRCRGCNHPPASGGGTQLRTVRHSAVGRSTRIQGIAIAIPWVSNRYSD